MYTDRYNLEDHTSVVWFLIKNKLEILFFKHSFVDELFTKDLKTKHLSVRQGNFFHKEWVFHIKTFGAVMALRWCLLTNLK